jgi:glutathione-regulated potassium-efflux system protein KefB
MSDHGFLANVVIFLLAVVLAVPLFNRLRLGAVLAYLVAGALIGPHGFALIAAGSQDLAVSELGVVLLLFLIGLELSYARLWLMRRAVFAVGTLQVALSMVLLGLAVFALGQSARTALIAAFALAMSSTAIGVQLLAERKQLGEHYGRTALAILLFQDLVAIPAIALIPMFSDAAATPGPNLDDTLLAIGKVLAALAAVFVLGRYLVRPLFRFVASTRSLEAFTATTLLIALGTAWLTSLAGISMAFGAFLAGLLLADSEFRHEIEAHIEPFKGLLLGLFFMSVGLTVDWRYVGDHALNVAVGVFGLLVVKFGVLYVLGRRAARLGRGPSLKLAGVLSQGGEFAFVILSLAADGKLMTGSTRDLLTAVVVLSMAATPLIVLALDRYAKNLDAPPPRPFDDIPQDQPARVIIAGFGRVGQIVARVLRAHRIPFTALEQSVEQVDTSRRFGNVIYYGDPSRPELLKAARADQAEIFVLATDDPESAVRTARLLKRAYPHLKIYARARNRHHAHRLMDLQLDAIVRETLYSSLHLAKLVLEGLGVPAEQATERIERFRQHDHKVLLAQYQVYDDEAKLVQTSKEAQAELEQLFEADLREE